jgi:hypothetical protein
MKLVIIGALHSLSIVYVTAFLSLWEHQEPEEREKERGCGPASGISSVRQKVALQGFSQESQQC